jgi:sigma-B regulation protein RsbU (phosphoserine phosphatase)
MANIQASLRTRFALGQDLASLANELDSDIASSTPGSVYATLFVGAARPGAPHARLRERGHNPQFVMRAAGGLERMDATGLPIGLLAGRGYGPGHLSLAPAIVLFFYTDGCVEAENMSGDMFGSARLEQSLMRCSHSSSNDVLVQIERDILQFRAGRDPFDDATMMVVNVG